VFEVREDGFGAMGPEVPCGTSGGSRGATLIANRLTSPTPLLRVEDWAREWAVEEVFGTAPDALNSDIRGAEQQEKATAAANSDP